MGTVNDIKNRSTQARVDNRPLRYDISSARRHIFEEGAAPEGTRVEGILGQTSCTPNRVMYNTLSHR